MDFPSSKKQFDLVIIGSGGSGLMAAIEAINCGVKNIAIISKVIPTNSHTVAAKGGINAALSNVISDNWKWHAYDTLKGSDYLADADAVELLCREAEGAIISLEKMGVVFSRNASGKISQRAYGGQTTDFGKGDVAYRACYSKDKTGHTILHTLYEQAIKKGVKIFSEFFVTDLLIEENQCHGCLAIDLNSGELVIFESQNLILATGGYSQIYKNTTSSLICTGDGSALVFEEGIVLQDMEFIQFHPTGIAGNGFLVTEAARGEGAYLLNSQGKRFMQDYAPKMMELASRDVISQAMATEIHEGRGVGKDKNALYLDLRHLSDEVLNNKLPGAVEMVKNFAKINHQTIDLKKDLIPVAPSAHYSMGGIATNLDCVVLDGEKEISGLMAVGEAACVSVHGANRLGCNSLLDLIVFGKIAGKKSSQKSEKKSAKIAEKISEKKIEKLKNIFADAKVDAAFSLSFIKKELQENNEKNLGVFRSAELLEKGISKTKELFEILKNYKIKNKNLIWNEEVIAYFEVKNLLLNSLAANFAAIKRKESRGAHFRSDFKERDDDNFLHHSLVSFKNELEFLAKPVRSVSEIPELNLTPQPRKY